MRQREKAQRLLLQQKEAQAKRDAEYAKVRKEVRSLPKPRTRSLPRTQQPAVVSTPRQAAPVPTRRVEQPYTTPYRQPAAPAATQYTIGDALIGASIGYVIGSVINNDRPSPPASNQCTANDSFTTGGGGDFGGGGAESSWDSGSSSDSSSSSD
jgi:hypothetical protein